MPELLKRRDVEYAARRVANEVVRRNSLRLRNYKIATGLLGITLASFFFFPTPRTWFQEVFRKEQASVPFQITSEISNDKLVLKRWNIRFNSKDVSEVGEFQRGAVIRLRSDNTGEIVALIRSDNRFKSARIPQICLKKEGAFIIFDARSQLFLQNSQGLLVMDLMFMSPNEAETFVKSQGGQIHQFE